MTQRLCFLLLAILFTVPALVDVADAQQKKEAGANKEASKPAPKIPDGAALNILIRRTLLTLNDANLSGNYTVLRDLAAPGFQSANDPAKLAQIFSKLRSRKMDFAPIVYFNPKLVREPEITKNGMLRLTGFMPTKPQQVNFDMLFQNVSGRWRLFGIAVNASPAKAAADAAKSSDTKSSEGASPKKKK